MYNAKIKLFTLAERKKNASPSENIPKNPSSASQ